MKLNFTACYKLWNRCAIALVYVGNSYEPAYMDSEGGRRHDAHLHHTRVMMEAIINVYADLATSERVAA